MKHAFTLIELSIVLIIIGLIAAGIIGGQRLIKNAELQSIAVDFRRYEAAIRSFELEFRQLPGDFDEATTYWGDNSTLCADAGVTNGAPGTCNGNGDGTIDAPAESNTFWQHLHLSENLPTFYQVQALTPVSQSFGSGNSIPEGSISGSYFIALSAGPFFGQSGNLLRLSIADSTIGLLSPRDARNLDLKVDDGSASSGVLLATTSDDRFATPAATDNCSSATTANGSADAAGSADYLVANNEAACVFNYMLK